MLTDIQDLTATIEFDVSEEELEELEREVDEIIELSERIDEKVEKINEHSLYQELGLKLSIEHRFDLSENDN